MPNASPYEPPIDDLRRRGTAKWATHDDDVLAAWVAEMDFETDPEVQDAVRRAVERHQFGYPPKRLAAGVARRSRAGTGAPPDGMSTRSGCTCCRT